MKAGSSAQRLDSLLVEKGLADSRSRAQALVMSGAVRVEGEVVTKAGTRVSPSRSLSVADGSPFVSRAGRKALRGSGRLRDRGHRT